MRIERFYTFLGLFVFGAIFLSSITAFFLYDLNLHKHADRYVMFFKGSLRGLDTTSSVTYKGVKIGQIKLIELTEDEANQQIKIPVYVQFYIERTFVGKQDPIKLLIDRGYVARIRQPNLLTGISSIDLVKPEIPRIIEQEYFEGYPIFPTLHRIEQYSTIDETLKKAQKTLQDISDFIVSEKVRETVDATKDMAMSFERLANTLNQRSPLVFDTVDQSLSNISGAANSMQNLMDYLSRNPESLLRGKK